MSEFRGRIVSPQQAYQSYSQLELDLRVVIGDILCQRDWWCEWRRDNGAKWLVEAEHRWITKAIQRARDKARKGWQMKIDEIDGYDHILRYFETALLESIPNDGSKNRQNFCVISEAARTQATQFLLAVCQGNTDGDQYGSTLPEALWLHVDRIVMELNQIRQCLTNTIGHLLTAYGLEAEHVTAFVSPGPVQETWIRGFLIHDDIKHKFVNEVAAVESLSGRSQGLAS